MNCMGVRQQLALAAGGDLPSAEALSVNLHVQECAECARFYQGLQDNQSVLRSLRQDFISTAALAEVRQNVLASVADARHALGWRIRLERFLLQGLRTPGYAVLTAGIVIILSLSLFGQMRLSHSEAAGAVIQFEEADTLLRPEGYREWVFVGSYLAAGHHESLAPHSSYFHNAYINPGAYRAYARTGEFPQGTVMVLETTTAESNPDPRFQGHRGSDGPYGSYPKQVVALEASVKDSRFEGGWGYFDFTPTEKVAESGVKVTAKATVLPAEAGCLSCHRQSAQKDHVFTQFYPVLGTILGVL